MIKIGKVNLKDKKIKYGILNRKLDYHNIIPVRSNIEIPNFELPKEVQDQIAEGVIQKTDKHFIYKSAAKLISQPRIDATIYSSNSNLKLSAECIALKRYRFWVPELYWAKTINFKNIYLRLINDGKFPVPLLNLFSSAYNFNDEKWVEICSGKSFANLKLSNTYEIGLSISDCVNTILSAPQNLDLVWFNNIKPNKYGFTTTTVHKFYFQLTRLHSLIKSAEEAQKWYDKYIDNFSDLMDNLLSEKEDADLSKYL